MKKIVLTGNREVKEVIPDEEFISSLDIYVPNSEKLHKELAPYLDQEMSDENLAAIKQKIVRHYQEHGRPLIVVEIPPQDVTCGTVQFWVMEGKMGNVSYSGNRWYPKKFIQKRVPLQSGDTFDEVQFLNNLAWLNQNPFHQTEISLAPGKEPYTTDAEFKTWDRFPLRVYAGTENTGTEHTCPSRWYVGANLSVPCVWDNILIYQFTAGYSLHAFQAHYGNFLLFFPWKQALSFFGGYAKIHPTITGFKQEGKSWQASGRHIVPILPLYSSFGQKIEWGVDFKNTNNNLFFTSATEVVPASSSSVNLFQIALNYRLEKAWGGHQLYFFLENYISPGEWLPDQTVSDYSNLRPGAKPLYYYSRATLSDRYQMPGDFILTMEFRAQATTTSLLPSEQFGLGGLYTVRGYEEREFNSDNGLLGNIEIASPSLLKQKWGSFKLIAFVDAGGGWNYHTSSGEAKTQYLIGIGPGARWAYKPYFDARIDYGFKLHDTPFGNSNLGRVHFSITAGY